MRLVLCVVIALVLGLIAAWVHSRFHMVTADAIAVVGLLAVAAALIPLLPKRWLRSDDCTVSNAYLELGEHEGWYTFHFEAHVLNEGSESDVLRQIKYAFYHLQNGNFPMSLIFGGKLMNEQRGQILPIPVEAGQTYFVEAKESFTTDSPRGKRLAADGAKYSDYVLRCRFIFSRSSPVTVRVHPHMLDKPQRFASWRLERQLGVRWSE